MMKKICLTILLSVFVGLVSTSQVFGQEVSLPLGYRDAITRFDSTISINKDTSITIEETIRYETLDQHHGILRYIPVRYTRNNITYKTSISTIKITDDKGNPVNFTRSSEGNFVTLKIGDPETTFTGLKTYRLSYVVSEALAEYEKYDELFWDITGEGWQIPVLHSHATVYSPHARITAAICYSGPVSKNDGQCNFSYNADSADFDYPKTISYGDNFTVAVALDKDNALAFPTPEEKLRKTILENILLILVPFPAVIMFLVWYAFGRDWMFVSANVFDMDPTKEKKKKPLFYRHRTPFVYEPMKALTPGEAGTVLDERVHNQDVVAEILDLARKKYLSIKEITKKGFLSSSKDFEFTRLKPVDDTLPEHQKYLLSSLFKTGTTVSLSDLKGSFYTHMEAVKSKISTILTSKKDGDPNKAAFTGNPKNTKIMYVVFAGLLVGASFMLMIFSSTMNNSGAPFLLFTGSAVITFALAVSMPQKTAIGTNYMLQAKGLKETIRRGKWREEIKEKHLFIEEVLPFAVALGVVDQLSKAMEELNIQPPSYVPVGFATSGHSSLSSFTNSFSNQTTSSLSYNPSSSSWSGGSGFSGGSSGGGGGGGGGGSW